MNYHNKYLERFVQVFLSFFVVQVSFWIATEIEVWIIAHTWWKLFIILAVLPIWNVNICYANCETQTFTFINCIRVPDFISFLNTFSEQCPHLAEGYLRFITFLAWAPRLCGKDKLKIQLLTEFPYFLVEIEEKIFLR